MNQLLNIHPEISEALNQGLPIVALESTIIAHGMPYPQNIETALEVEQIVRKNGAIPATIAILDGKLCVGLNAQQLELLGNTKDVWKVSLRDMPYVLSQKILGATTVAATMRIASMVGIHLFEMAQTNVAVVSAGVKSILDIGLTLEYLETSGLPVVTFGQDDYPAFYSRKSGFKSPLRLDTAEEIANLMHVKWQMGLNGSVLIANPIKQEDEVPFEKMEGFIRDCLKEADNQKISGKNITPFLLKRIAEITGGDSLKSNIALVKNNAVLGARIALGR